ncbi:unnamed protein product [Cuscuta epithymum]|uniref:Uncharacterized protein n=1 Tax=Cuscuta epithymum TaxID=186058 RepID=A0AAV0D3U5_9ASTE|nr:unnamed protein product [Cuscuta epithymum]
MASLAEYNVLHTANSFENPNPFRSCSPWNRPGSHGTFFIVTMNWDGEFWVILLFSRLNLFLILFTSLDFKAEGCIEPRNSQKTNSKCAKIDVHEEIDFCLSI